MNKKKTMNGRWGRWMAMAGLVGVLAMGGSGCVSPAPMPQPPRQPKPTIEVEPATRPKRLPPAETTRRPPQEKPPREKAPQEKPSREMPKASETARALRVRFDVAAPDAPILARVLSARVEGTLAGAGYKVAHDGEADVEASADIRARVRNSRGSRVAWTADADVQVLRAVPARGARGGRPPEMISRSWMDVKSGTARSGDDAQKALAEKLADEIAPFAGDAVRRAAGSLRRVEVSIRHAWPDERAAERYPGVFTETMGRLPGVCRCKVLSMDAKKGLRAEVVYDEAAFPEGFVNKLKTVPELRLSR